MCYLVPFKIISGDIAFHLVIAASQTFKHEIWFHSSGTSTVRLAACCYTTTCRIFIIASFLSWFLIFFLCLSTPTSSELFGSQDLHRVPGESRVWLVWRPQQHRQRRVHGRFLSWAPEAFKHQVWIQTAGQGCGGRSEPLLFGQRLQLGLYRVSRWVDICTKFFLFNRCDYINVLTLLQPQT